MKEDQLKSLEIVTAECADEVYKFVLDKFMGRTDIHECLYYTSVLLASRSITCNGHLNQDNAVQNLSIFLDDVGVVLKTHFAKK